VTWSSDLRGKFPISDSKKQLDNWYMNSLHDYRSAIANVIYCSETEYRRSADGLNLLLRFPDLTHTIIVLERVNYRRDETVL